MSNLTVIDTIMEKISELQKLTEDIQASRPEVLDQFNMICEESISLISDVIYSEISQIDPTIDISPDMWTQEIIHLYLRSNTETTERINRLKELSDVSQRLLSAQMKANRCVDLKSPLVSSPSEIQSELTEATVKSKSISDPTFRNFNSLDVESSISSKNE